MTVHNITELLLGDFSDVNVILLGRYYLLVIRMALMSQ